MGALFGSAVCGSRRSLVIRCAIGALMNRSALYILSQQRAKQKPPNRQHLEAMACVFVY